MVMIKYSNEEFPNFGSFSIDGRDPNMVLLSTQCIVGSPSSCLGNTATKAHNDTLPAPLRFKAPKWHLHRDKKGNVKGGTISFTYGQYRYERPMTAFEAQMADKFDKTGRLPRRKVVVDLDTSRPQWTRKPKQSADRRPGPNQGHAPGYQVRRSKRTRELQEWRDMMAGRGV